MRRSEALLLGARCSSTANKRARLAGPGRRGEALLVHESTAAKVTPRADANTRWVIFSACRVSANWVEKRAACSSRVFDVVLRCAIGV